MAEEEQATQIQFLQSDFNTRLKDAEERNRLIRERVLLLGKNLISSKEGIDKEIIDLKKLKTLTQGILSETHKFVRKDEMVVIERMLKDFQPLEFIREKDVEELISSKLKKLNRKTIKSTKTQ